MGEKGMHDESEGGATGGSGGTRVSSVAPPDSGQPSIADEQGTRQPAREPGGAPSGSITHPETDRFEQATLAKDADGTWRASNDARGDRWRWDPDAGIWRGEGRTEDWAGPPPEEIARDLSAQD